ncbi:MAG TPA: hypothetical protein VJL87_01445, partial [Bdellovibrionota bacterium]|nr:hypothetical protein [Bdellovibrionota bacterium]
MKRTLVLTFLICLGILVPTWANADGMLAAVTAVEESTGPVLPTATGDFVEGGTAATKGLSAGAVTGVGIGLGALQLVGGVIADRGAENLGYGIAATGELGWTVLSTYMAMTAPDVFSRIAYGMAAAGEAYSLYGTVDNWLKHDPGDGGGGSSDDSKLD